MICEHLQPILESDRDTGLSCHVATLVARGCVPPMALPDLRMGCLTALKKPQGGASQQTERSHKRGCQGPFALFVMGRPFAASPVYRYLTRVSSAFDLMRRKFSNSQSCMCVSSLSLLSIICTAYMTISTRVPPKKTRWGEIDCGQ